MSNQPTAHFRWEIIDGVAVVEVLSIELNQPRFADEFAAQLRGVLATQTADRLLINFQNTKYASSSVFARLIEFAKIANEAGVRLAICGMVPSVLMGAEILCLDQAVPIFPDQATALAALQADLPEAGTLGDVTTEQRT